MGRLNEINTSKRDARDGHGEQVGYEINFNRYFHRFKPPPQLGEIQTDIQRNRARNGGDASGGGRDTVPFGAGSTFQAISWRRKIPRSNFLRTLRSRKDKMNGNEITFEVTEAPEGGYHAQALGHGVFTQGEDWDDLKEMVRDAVRCHFVEDEVPGVIRLHFVRDETIAV